MAQPRIPLNFGFPGAGREADMLDRDSRWTILAFIALMIVMGIVTLFYFAR